MGDRRAPLQTRGHAQCVGRVSLGVPYLHSDSLPSRESADVSRALSLSLSSFSLSLFFALARFSLSLLSLSLPRFPRISAWTSPRCIVRPLERFQPIGAPHDDFIMKKRNVRVDQTPFAICKGRCAGDGTGHAACVSRMFTVAG